MDLNKLFDREQFSIGKLEKETLMLDQLKELHALHYDKSDIYKSVTDLMYASTKDLKHIDQLPFLPVSAFKNHEIKSISDEDVFKVLTSSGTTGQAVSKIYLNKETAQLQTLALSKIMTHILGKARLPMLIIDSKAVYKNGSSFSARGAGILGLSIYGKDHTYILDDNFNPVETSLADFLEKYQNQPVLIFGFTFMVWEYLYLSKLEKKYDLSNAILVHSGGWKKLIDMAVDNSTFKEKLNEKFGLKHIYNFYGMVEQVGSVFIENSEGYLHCPNFADVIIRNPYDFSVQPNGTEGLIQVISTLPKSYPGHSLLTEDIGVIMGEDNCSNGWKGKYFKILGRAKRAELRGCSDTFKGN